MVVKGEQVSSGSSWFRNYPKDDRRLHNDLAFRILLKVTGYTVPTIPDHNEPDLIERILRKTFICPLA